MKTNLKKIFVAAALILSCSTILADNTVIITKGNGHTDKFLFAENPKLTYEGTNVVMSVKQSKVYYNIDEGVKVTFQVEGTPTNIPTPATSSNYFKMEGDDIIITSSANAKVEVYGQNGVSVYSTSCDRSGNATISTANYSNGLYIISVNNSTFKYLKK